MKSAIRQLPRLLDSHGVGPQDRSYVLALGLARAIAYDLALPTSPVEQPMVHFNLQHLDTVNGLLSETNELVVINVDLAVTLTKKLWLMRYNLVFESDNVAVRQILDDVISLGSCEIPPHATEICRTMHNQGFFNQVAVIFDDARG
jgi:hypothetical protein